MGCAEGEVSGCLKILSWPQGPYRALLSPAWHCRPRVRTRSTVQWLGLVSRTTTATKCTRRCALPRCAPKGSVGNRGQMSHDEVRSVRPSACCARMGPIERGRIEKRRGAEAKARARQRNRQWRRNDWVRASPKVPGHWRKAPRKEPVISSPCIRFARELPWEKAL